MAYGPVSIGGYQTLAPATANELGGIKVGYGLSVSSDGQLNVDVRLAYPIGSIYMTESSISPAFLFGGTWTKIASNRVLMGAGGQHAAGTISDAGLPSITGTIPDVLIKSDTAATGAFSSTGTDSINVNSAFGFGTLLTLYPRQINLDTYTQNQIYGASDTVQPAAFYVIIWKRLS